MCSGSRSGQGQTARDRGQELHPQTASAPAAAGPSAGSIKPPAAVFFYSPDRAGKHPAGHLADFSKVATERSKNKAANFSPIAFEAVRRIDAIFDLERPLIGLPENERLKLRQQYVKAQVESLENWMRTERAKLSRHNPVAKAMDYMLNRWVAFTRFLENGKICLTNNAAEKALRCVAVGRKNWTFCGSDRGGERAAAIYTMIATAKLNDIGPKACELLPWNWRKQSSEQSQAQGA